MAELKTQPNDGDVTGFISCVEHEQRKADSLELLRVMKELTGEEPKMWGASIVGFGEYHYTYESGREGDWFMVGFSPRKQSMTLYIMDGFAKYDELLSALGKYKTGKSCLYVNKLDDVNREILKQLIAESYQYMKEKYHQ